MGYQALLFCPDEKLARVVSQVFSELDFTVDPVHEPFAAVKQLMAQRYDAVVVDCDNEQNASLLFRSARNSSSNQSSLAFALVEGQTGVAKAYRIGANLVLTKPVNVEQAKGTLRIARGLLRKNSDAAGASTSASAMAAKAAAASAGGSSVTSALATAVAAPGRGGSNDLATSSTPAPAASSSAKTLASSPASSSSLSSATVAHSREGVKSEMVSSTATAENVASNFAVNSAAAVEEKQGSSTTAAGDEIGNSGAPKSFIKYDSAKIDPGLAATATAPAKEASKEATTSGASGKQEKGTTEKKKSETKAAASSQASASASAAAASTSATPLSLASATSAPSFGGLSEGTANGSGRNKKILIAVVAVLALAAFSYFSDGKLSKFGTTRPEPAQAPQNSSQPAPAVKPMSAPETAPPTGQTDMASTATYTSGRQTTGTTAARQTAGSDNTDLARVAADDNADTEAQTSAPQPKKRGAAPLMVNSQTVNSQTIDSHSGRARLQAQADESAPPSPSTLAMTAANNGQLGGVMSSASLDVSQPSLATIKISQGVSQGLLIKRVQPKYPEAALAAHAQGSVQLEATINKDGSVVNPKVLKGDPLLARAAVDAVRQWRYKPYYLNGSPVEIQTEITIRFKAQ